MKKVATITLYRDIEECELTGRYQEVWNTKLTVEVSTPFGEQEFDVNQETQYSEKPKSLAGAVGRFERICRESTRECLKLLRSNMIRERNIPGRRKKNPEK